MTILVIVIVFILVVFGLVAFLGAPYVPSHRKDVRRVFDHFGVDSSDTVVDIGSGDGLVLRLASNYGAQVVGYEVNPFLVAISKLLSWQDARVSVRLQNAWLATFPETTTIVYIFSVSRDEKRITKLLQRQADRLQKPLKLLCYGSPFKQMQPDDTFEAYHLYIFRPLQLKNA